MVRVRTFLLAIGLASAPALRAHAQSSVFTQPAFIPTSPALEDERRERSEWVLPEARGYEDDVFDSDVSDSGPSGGGSSGSDWDNNPYNPANLEKAVESQQADLEAENPRAKHGASDPGSKRAHKRGDRGPEQHSLFGSSFELNVDISGSKLGSVRQQSLPGLEESAPGSGTQLGDITGGGPERLSIWELDDDRERMRRKKQLGVRENELESDEEVLIREQQKEASGGTDFFDPF